MKEVGKLYYNKTLSEYMTIVMCTGDGIFGDEFNGVVIKTTNPEFSIGCHLNWLRNRFDNYNEEVIISNKDIIPINQNAGYAN